MDHGNMTAETLGNAYGNPWKIISYMGKKQQKYA